MAIYKGSRYEYSTVDFIAKTLNGASNPVVFYQFSNIATLTYYEHTYTQGERLDQLATKYYKNPLYWWLIAEFNSSVDLTNIPAGTILRIPSV